MRKPATPELSLSGRRVLVVEDEYFIADDIARALKKLGGEVVGPVPDVDQAEALLAAEPIDFAVLDINLRGNMVYSVAEQLRARGVPFVFATGYDRSALPAGFEDVPRWEKPFDYAALARSLPALARTR